MILALVSPVLASTSDDMRDPISWILSLGKGGKSGQGPQGDPGPAGPPGTVVYVDCGENQCIMNQTANQTPGPQGPIGPAGPQGVPGEPADILVNNTETVPAGDNAYVVDVGEPGLAKLDFKIPRGYNGTAGSPGAKGDPGAQGNPGPQGDPGPTGPANMTAGPQGPQGDPGPTGPMGPMNQTANMTAGPPGSPGTAATINVNYTFTGAAGTSALVTNVGTTSAALLDFTIPTGTTDSLTFPCKACSAGTIYKGQAVYISGAVGNNPIVCQADNTDTAKSRVVGLMIANTAANGQGGVRRAGELEPVDTRTTNTVINPNGETWNSGDLLFATTGGGLTKTRPTSGRSVKVAYVTEAAGVNAALLAYPMENPVWVTAASNEDIVLRTGDSAGTNKVSIRNYANTEMAYINSQGYASLNGTDLQSKKITSVADPGAAQDAATKNYVDTTVAGKGYTIPIQSLTYSPVEGNTIYFGCLPMAPTTTAGIAKQYIPRAGTIKKVYLYTYSGTAGTNELWQALIRINNAADTRIQNQSVNTNERVFSNTGLSIAVNAGDYFEIKMINPTWATNPLTFITGGTVYVE